MEGKDGYGSVTGLVFIFNLIVGTGALTMPAAFAKAGWVLSLIIIILLCFISFMTVSFVIESMSIANAIISSEILTRGSSSASSLSQQAGGTPSTSTNSASDDSNVELDDSNAELIVHAESAPLIKDTTRREFRSDSELKRFEIKQQVEMGKMAHMFFPGFTTRFFYICIAVYLYGDLAIYAAAIAKSLRDVSCSVHPSSSNDTLHPSDPCWTSANITRHTSYQLYVTGVLLFLGPLAFFNVSKTKYLQILTTLFRWISFSAMIILASMAMLNGKGRGNPPVASIWGLPNLFGVCVYSFMCHHSLPSLVTPIRRKENIYWLMGSDYILILSFYLLLSFTGAYTFEKPADIYTLSFQDLGDAPEDQIIPRVKFLQYFLPLFPVFTLSASFPIISITLRNNLKNLFMPVIFRNSLNQPTADTTSFNRRKWYFTWDRILFPVIAVLPPVILALLTENLQLLVGIVGSYAGTSIQYVIPAMLVFYARRKRDHYLDEHNITSVDELKVMKNYSSPFRHKYWIYFVFIWSILCVIFVTVDHIIDNNT